MEAFAECGILCDESLQFGQVRSVDLEPARRIRLFHPAMQAQIRRTGTRAGQTSKQRGPVDHVLCHLSVGRPLPSGNRNQLRLRNQDGVLTRDHRCTLCFCLTDERPLPGPDAEHLTGCGTIPQESLDVAEEKLALLRKRAWLILSFG